MATITIAQPHILPVVPGAAVLPTVYLGGKALPSLLSHRKKPLPLTRVALNPPPKTFGRLTLRAPKPYLVPQVSSSLSYLPYDTAVTTTDTARTLAAIFSIAVSVTNHLIRAIISAAPNPRVLLPAMIQSLKGLLASSAWKVFSAVINEYYFFRHVTTPLTPVVLVMWKFLDIYYAIVVLRVTLFWFDPPWDKQPFSAIRDLADPYLYWFRKVSLPVKIHNLLLDVSPIYATSMLDIVMMMIKPHCLW